MNYLSEGGNNWYFIHQSKNNEPIKIFLKDSVSQVVIDKPSNVLQIISESIINDADDLKQKYISQINKYLKQTLLDLIDEQSSEAIQEKYGQYFERAGVFLKNDKSLSESDIQKLLNETRLLSIEVEILLNEPEGLVSFCSANLIDPFMIRWSCAFENKYHFSEGFIECG